MQCDICSDTISPGKIEMQLKIDTAVIGFIEDFAARWILCKSLVKHC